MASWITDEQTKRVAEINAEIAKINADMKAVSTASQEQLKALRDQHLALISELEKIKV